MSSLHSLTFFFFNDTATTEIYTLSLHDALPIWIHTPTNELPVNRDEFVLKLYFVKDVNDPALVEIIQNIVSIKDRKSTRLNSSHLRESRMPSSA